MNHNESNLIVAEKFIKTLSCEIHKTMTVCNILSYIDSLDSLADEYNNTCHWSSGKITVIAD